MSTKIEFVDTKNPTWHIGDVYWTERPDHHFYQCVTYEWRHREIGFRGKGTVYLPGDTHVADFIDAMDSLGNGYEYHVHTVWYMSPVQVRERVEAAAACYR